ncbi:uncharacterized protein LOC123448535 [Hordeum vulgare subsp. vulgare]|uniref:uncharacterized protein LOC123448535 n=1 Tax=Hordeum vulgare subsp. vulgare TaxID=112509 RepID=UPI00162CD42A|nr:uncharacterized protein LOC123448535 [Hordeum vulgare subsp. vulgare]
MDFIDEFFSHNFLRDLDDSSFDDVEMVGAVLVIHDHLRASLTAALYRAMWHKNCHIGQKRGKKVLQQLPYLHQLPYIFYNTVLNLAQLLQIYNTCVAVLFSQRRARSPTATRKFPSLSRPRPRQRKSAARRPRPCPKSAARPPPVPPAPRPRRNTAAHRQNRRSAVAAAAVRIRGTHADSATAATPTTLVRFPLAACNTQRWQQQVGEACSGDAAATHRPGRRKVFEMVSIEDSSDEEYDLEDEEDIALILLLHKRKKPKHGGYGICDADVHKDLQKDLMEEWWSWYGRQRAALCT